VIGLFTVRIMLQKIEEKNGEGRSPKLLVYAAIDNGDGK